MTEKLVTWADLIFVMEKKHKERLKDQFGLVVNEKEIVVLDIEDNYMYMDSELIQILEESVLPYLDNLNR